MSNDISLDMLLAEIAERSGPPLKLDARGNCAIEHGGAFEIVLTSCDNGESVLPHSPIRFIDPLAQLHRCLEISLYGAETGGATLALDPESDAIGLWQRLAVADLDSHALAQRSSRSRPRPMPSARACRSRTTKATMKTPTAPALGRNAIRIGF